MKKLAIILGVIIIVILAAAFIIPVVFKDDIKAAIDSALAESVNADIVFDTDDFSISLFTNFPNATAGLNNFGVINRAPFEGEILFAVKEFEVEIDIFSLFGEQIKINGIRLLQPEINIKVLEDGRANYDIAIASEEEAAQSPSDEQPTNFNIGINHWEIVGANMVYDDATMPISLVIKNMSHSGSGDFNQDVFDLSTLTNLESISVVFDGIEYLSNKTVNADIVMSISENYSRYTFKENKATVNDFGLGFDGFLKLNDDESMDMDLSYSAKDATFKSLLSLVPGIYTADFQGIETAGNLSFNGTVSGKYDSLTLPAFNVALIVKDAMFKYPDLPTAITNINLDMLVDNKDGVIDHTLVNLKQFHMDFGNNPIDASVLISNLSNYDMDAKVMAKLNLAELTSMFPIEGTALKGNFALDLKAKGYYDSIAMKTPTIDAAMSLTNGFVKSTDLPYALDKMKINAEVKSPTGKMVDFVALVKDFSMEMDGEPFSADLEFANLDNYSWKLNAAGGIDLEKITKVFPLEGMTLAGIIKANLSTAGNMADLDAERYDRLPTSGKVNITNFSYADDELPYNVTISAAQASFDPKKVSIDNYKGTIGKSDIAITGSVTNYIGYLFGENQTLKGTMSLNSQLLDLNEFMTDDEGTVADTVTTAEESYGVVEIPKDIDFVMKSTIRTVTVMDMSMTDMKGDIIARDGVVNLNGLGFNLLGGAFGVNGTYDPRDLEKPKYDFKLKIDNLSASKAFETFTIVQEYFPIAKNIGGNISTDFKINGLLDQEMMPDLNTVGGAGLINLANGTLKNSKVLKGVGSLIGSSSLSNTDQIPIKDVLMSMTIADGLVTIKPFDLTMAGYKSNLGGTSTLAGGLDFDLKMDVPAGKLGSQVNSLISQYTGGSGSSDNTIIPLNIGIGGTADDPTFKLKGSGTKKQTTEIATKVVKDQVKEQLGVDVDAERKKIMDDAQKQADKIIAEGKKAADKTRSEGYAQADRLVKEAGSNPIKKRIAEEAAKKLKKEADDSANTIEAESKKQANDLLAKAKKQADAIK